MSRTADVLTNYCDDDLTFFALTYKNYDATAECLRDLRKHYSASRVILRSDGDPDPRFSILAQRNKVDFRGELRLFGIENGGAVIERMTDRANRCGLASFDWILPWIASEFGIPIYPFDEVNSGWQQAPPNPNQRYAVSHPRAVIQLPS